VAGPNGNDVVVYEVHAGGHTVPQSWMPLTALLVGTTNEDINAVNEIWYFFFSSNH
jgi:poly(3-hydroxybutyrate) depolymerase